MVVDAIDTCIFIVYRMRHEHDARTMSSEHAQTHEFVVCVCVCLCVCVWRSVREWLYVWVWPFVCVYLSIMRISHSRLSYIALSHIVHRASFIVHHVLYIIVYRTSYIVHLKLDLALWFLRLNYQRLLSLFSISGHSIPARFLFLFVLLRSLAPFVSFASSVFRRDLGWD